MLRISWMISSMAIAALLVLSSCGDGEGNGATFSCSYETRRTECGGSNWSEWTSECATIDFELKEGLSQSDFCAGAYPSSDTECQGGCCVNFEFRNVAVQNGSCNGEAS